MAALKKHDGPADKTPRGDGSGRPAAELLGQMAGEYRIIRQIGVGGFGAVYEAEHPLLQRRAAVKVLHSHPALDSAGVSRFIEEARAASQIRHHNIVDIFSFGTLPNGQYFYAMDLFEGVPLDRYLREQVRLSPEQSLPLLKPIASALDALHAASIVHRDVKPANIYLAWESSGEVVPKLLDFGLVKLLGDNGSVHSISGVPMGTPHYMSPEQCRGEKVDARADIYALGVVCHEVLTGTRPFTGESTTSVLVAHVLQTPPRMSECAAVSPELDASVLAMLAKDPAARPASALAAVRALEQAALQAGITFADGPLWLPRLPPGTRGDGHSLASGDTVERSGLRTGPVPEPSRSRWLQLGLAGVVVLALALLVGLWFALAPTRPPPPSAPPVAAVEVAPAPPPSAAATLPPSAATPPATVELLLRGAPANAVVMLGDRNLGEASAPLTLPYATTPLRLQLMAPGYVPLVLSVTPDQRRELQVALDRQPRVIPKRSGVPRDLEDPF